MITLDEGGRAGPWLRVRSPRGPLARWAELSWIQALPERVARPAWRIVPDAAPHLLVTRPTAGEDAGVRLVGPRATWFDADQTGRAFTVGLRLRPGALGPLFGISASDVTDRSVSVSELDGLRLGALDRRVADARSAPEALDVVERWCARRGRDGAIERRTRTLGRLVESREGRMTASDLADEVGLSPRRLRTVARDEIGLAPKRMLRIARAHAVLRRGRAGQSHWSRVAVGAGYHDESHMIHDFRNLLGETPRRFAMRGPPVSTIGEGGRPVR